MIKSKRGTQIFFILMMGIVFFLLGLALTPAILDVTEEATTTSEFNCTAGNLSLTDQDKAVCTSLDVQQFLFIGTIFGLAGLLIGGIALK